MFGVIGGVTFGTLPTHRVERVGTMDWFGSISQERFLLLEELEWDYPEGLPMEWVPQFFVKFQVSRELQKVILKASTTASSSYTMLLKVSLHMVPIIIHWRSQKIV